MTNKEKVKQAAKNGAAIIAVVAKESAAQKMLKAKAAERAQQVALMASDIVQAIIDAQDAEQDFQGLMVSARLSGFTWDELEAQLINGADGKPMQFTTPTGKVRNLSLKDIARYRKAKSRIKAFEARGGKLEHGITASELEAGKAPRKSASKDDEPKDDEPKDDEPEATDAPINADGTPAQYRAHTAAEFVEKAFAMLAADADLRDAHGDAVIKLAAQIKEERAAEKDAARREVMEKKAA